MPPDKPSGLSTTKADWWVINDKKRYCWVKPKDIWKIIKLGNYKPVRFVGKGDTTPKTAYLVEKWSFIYSSLVKVVNKNES